MDSNISPPIYGLIDRTPPEKFGQGLFPKNEKYLPGDEISATFTEKIDCTRPFNFDVKMTVDTNPMQVLQGSDLPLYCDGNKIVVEISSTSSFAVGCHSLFGLISQYEDAIGKKMTVTLSGVRDLAGNTIKQPLTWSFVMQDFGAEQATVRISGFKLNIPFAQVDDFIAAALRISLARTLGVPESQLTNFSPSLAPDGNTLFSFDILPPSSQGSRAAVLTASEIAAMLNNLDVTQDPFLNANVDPESQVSLIAIFVD